MSQYTREEIIAKVKRGESLAGADLRGADLGGTDLRGADLRGVKLNGTNLCGAKLFGADFGGADLIGVDLRGTNLILANLCDANLCDVDLRKVKLRGADLISAHLCRANLCGANLWGANLWKANLWKANLRDCDLSSAILNQANLIDTNLTGANIWGIANTGWEIEGIEAEYVYNCVTPWDEKAKTKTRRDFKPGEFEAIYKSLPTIEMVFEGGLSPQDYVKLVGLTEIIRQQKPDINLEVKAMEKVGLDTILRFTLSQDEYLEDATHLIARLFQERGLGQKLLPILNEKFGIPLRVEPSQPIFNNCQNIVVNLINTGGEPLKGGKIGDIYNITDSNIAIGAGAIANYNAHQAEVDKLLAELSKTNQALVEALTAALKANDQDKVQSTWEQIKESISTGAAASSIFATLGKLLGLPI